MTSSVIYSDRAIETFDLISNQIRNRWGEKYVQEFELKVLQVIDNIKTYPYLYQPVNLNSNVRKSVVHKNCSMLYEVEENHITIHFFWDNRQEPIL